MLNKIKIHTTFKINMIIIISFFLMSILSSILLWHYKYIGIGLDAYFHTQRIYDLHSSLKNGIVFPLVALNGFNQTGSAVMTMYPQPIVLPVTFLSFLVTSVVTFVYTTFILRNFIALIISFYSCYGFSHDRKLSFIFATIYTLNPFVISYAIVGYDVGRSATLMFLPMILFGFYDLINNNRWVQLSTGMSAIIISHVLNTVISVMLLLCLLIFNYKKLNSNNLKSLYKSILVSIMVTGTFWIPFLLLSINNKIWIPRFWTNLSGINLMQSLNSSASNAVDSTSITIFAIFGLILALLYYKKLNNHSKQMVIISIMTLFLTTQLFPWNILDSTFIKNILQFPWRFLIIPQILLCYLFSEISTSLSFKTNKDKNIFVLTTIILSLLLQLSAQKSFIDNTRFNPELTSGYGQSNIYNKIYNTADLNNLIHTTKTTGASDYYPEKAVSQENNLNNHIATYGNKSLPVSLGGNGTFYIKTPNKIKNLSLPFLYYKGINYEVLLDGQRANFSADSNDLMSISNITKGKHKVQIIVHKTVFEILSYIISTSGIVILLFSIIKQMKRKNN